MARTHGIASSLERAKLLSKAKPIQPKKRIKREKPDIQEPRRQSLRLRREVVDPNESPLKKRKREAEAEKLRQKQEEERFEQEERARQAKKPRHEDLDLSALAEAAELTPKEFSSLTATLQLVAREPQPRRIASRDAFVFDNDSKDKEEISRLKESLQNLKVVSRAKVTQERIYSAAYHPEKSKDLIFFGDKYGQLGIWDARAASDEVEDEDGDVTAPENREGGKYWRLQPHWPAASKSSISAVKLDPIDAHSVFTSAYDCTIRNTSFTSGLSREVFAITDTLISSFDLPPTGNEMWISDADGGLTHLDLRQDKAHARRWALSGQKIGCLNNVVVLDRIWDARMLQDIPLNPMAERYPLTNELDEMEEYMSSPKGKKALVAEWPHNKSVSAAYWDPRGRSIVSTSYDDKLRIWDVADELKRGGSFRSSKPFCSIQHNCQTGRWLTILKAQWTPNPDVYPHFTVGNMNQSLDIFSSKVGASFNMYKLITAVQAVTCSHPSIVERAASANASGRCVLWAPSSESN
ncbi:WD40 repeat-like protein [Phellopilus nigrolimitatus]|nr:WD40 repeat-like protein [Phellopilus nigrolimitatus]